MIKKALTGRKGNLMSIHELDAKVKDLRELRNFEAEIKAEIAVIEDELKAEMLARNPDTLQGQDCGIPWRTIVARRFDSAAFRLTRAELFRQYSKATTSRRLVIA